VPRDFRIQFFFSLYHSPVLGVRFRSAQHREVAAFSLTPVENLSLVLLIPVMHLELWKSPRILEKIWNDPIVIFRGWGKMIREKNLKQTILWHCPFKIHIWSLKYLMHMISAHMSFLCRWSVHAKVTDACPERMHKNLMHMLSISLSLRIFLWFLYCLKKQK
jgi:hypothetical protein